VNNAADIENMRFDFSGGQALPAFAPVLIGVVGSGNLEVMLEPAAAGLCSIEVQTSARGFQPIWAAVLGDFHQRHGLAGLRVSINDMGATPAVVSLRLQQAVAQLRAGAA
jgi:malonate decarboxylase delta subunit